MLGLPFVVLSSISLVAVHCGSYGPYSMVEIGSHNDLDSINIENEENFVIQDPKPKQTLGSVARVTPAPHPLPSSTAPKPKKPEEDAHSLNFQDDDDSLLEDENFEEMTAESMEIPQQVDIPVQQVIFLFLI